MQKMIEPQMPLVQGKVDHRCAEEIAAISEILDEEPAIVHLVYADLGARGVRMDLGRRALSAEQIVRALLVKQMCGLTYEELSFQLADSATLRTFCRIGIGDPTPTRSALHRSIKALSPETLEAINKVLIARAVKQGLEPGRKVRTDCTPVESNIHEPTDSTLLWDCIRVLSRLSSEAAELTNFGFVNHTKKGKRRMIGILNAKSAEQRVELYRDLLGITREVVSEAGRHAAALLEFPPHDLLDQLRAASLTQDIEHFTSLANKVIAQTQRRVLLGESLPPDEKIVSIFEPHTDIIKKDRRDITYGHKIALSTGVSALVLDCVVLEGNPADSTLAVPMAQRASDVLGAMPEQVSFDGGFASRDNLEQLKAMGIKEVAFSKGRGLQVEEMTTSQRVYRLLRRFRAGIEAGISFLKRCFGLTRCTWRSLRSFKAYVWSSILAANLLMLARKTAA
jgi:transposase, IS5 family